jgi:glucose-6-phosphate 1-epimerase
MTKIETPLVTGENGLRKVVLVAADGARAEMYEHGAHVTSWVPAADTERLFLSPRAEFEPGSGIRGGVPVIFPQFANEGPYPKHGFARNMPWQLLASSPNGSAVAEAKFRLLTTRETYAIWPYSFVAELTVALRSNSLELTLDVMNNSRKPFTFTSALHTYLRVSDVRETHVRGLRGCSYRDSAAGGAHRDETADELAIEGEVNRIYFDVTGPLSVSEPRRTTTIEMEGFTDVVIWNPGPRGVTALADMEPDGYLRMLCVEAAAIGNPVTLQCGERWSGRQQLRAQ